MGKTVLAGTLLPPLGSMAADDTQPVTGDDLGKRIDALVAQLGHREFQMRKQATHKLIALARDTTLPAARAAVKTAMRKLVHQDDPEVTERARHILLAIEDKPVPPPPMQVPQLDGDIVIDL